MTTVYTKIKTRESDIAAWERDIKDLEMYPRTNGGAIRHLKACISDAQCDIESLKKLLDYEY